MSSRRWADRLNAFEFRAQLCCLQSKQGGLTLGDSLALGALAASLVFHAFFRPKDKHARVAQHAHAHTA